MNKSEQGIVVALGQILHLSTYVRMSWFGKAKLDSNQGQVADPVKLFFFDNEEFFPFFAGKLACLIHMEKN